MKREIFICSCYSLEHQVAFWYDTEDNLLYVQPHLITHRNLLKRFYVALKYMFGYRSRFGEWDETILSGEDQKKLYDILDKHHGRDIN